MTPFITSIVTHLVLFIDGSDCNPALYQWRCFQKPPWNIGIQYCSYWVAVISSTVLGCASGDRAWGAGKRGTDTPGSRGFVAWSIQLNLFYQKHYYNPKNPEPLGFLVGLMCISKIHPFFFHPTCKTTLKIELTTYCRDFLKFVTSFFRWNPRNRCSVDVRSETALFGSSFSVRSNVALRFTDSIST